MNYVDWDGAQRRRQYLVHNATEPKWRIALQFMKGNAAMDISAVLGRLYTDCLCAPGRRRAISVL
jgi:hypothetical protein